VTIEATIHRPGLPVWPAVLRRRKSVVLPDKHYQATVATDALHNGDRATKDSQSLSIHSQIVP